MLYKLCLLNKFIKKLESVKSRANAAWNPFATVIETPEIELAERTREMNGVHALDERLEIESSSTRCSPISTWCRVGSCTRWGDEIRVNAAVSCAQKVPWLNVERSGMKRPRRTDGGGGLVAIKSGIPTTKRRRRRPVVSIERILERRRRFSSPILLHVPPPPSLLLKLSERTKPTYRRTAQWSARAR